MTAKRHVFHFLVRVNKKECRNFARFPSSQLRRDAIGNSPEATQSTKTT